MESSEEPRWKRKSACWVVSSRFRHGKLMRFSILVFPIIPTVSGELLALDGRAWLARSVGGYARPPLRPPLLHRTCLAFWIEPSD
ncbi:hypothetical protein V6N13_124298 [Hibiscus sabdariffa]